MAVAESLQALGRLNVVLLAILAYHILRAIYNLYFHPLSKVPGPYVWSVSRLPFVRSLLRGTIITDVERLHRKYGPVLRIAPDEVAFARPDAWKDILQPRLDHQQFLKDPIWWKTQDGLPVSLVTAIDPEAHAGIRKFLAPGFTPRALRKQEPVLHFYSNLLIERLCEKLGETQKETANAVDINIVEWLNFTTFDIFGDLGFGESFQCLENSRYHPWISLLFDSMVSLSFLTAARFYPLLEYLLCKCIPPYIRRKLLDHYQQIADKVHRRLNLDLERPDIMSHVISQKGDLSLPIETINATFMILTIAGSETTATALSGTLNYLVNNRDQLLVLVREIRERFQSKDEISLESLQKLPYLNAVLSEGLRLCTPIPSMLPRRVPKGGDTVCGIWLPGNTAVSIQSYAMNRDPKLFHAAASFLPERWLPEASSELSSPFLNDKRQAVQPFGLGPRSCIGQGLAWAELRLILSKLLWTFDFEAIEGKVLRWEDLRTFILVEKKPIMLRMKLRPASPVG